MSLNGRAWFAWPSSGRPRDPDGAAFDKPVCPYCPFPQQNALPQLPKVQWRPAGRGHIPTASCCAQVPDKGEPAVPSFALVIMDVDTVDYVLLPNLRVGYTSTLEADGKRNWSEQELNP